MATTAWFRKQCKERGITITSQRLAIYRALSKSFDHPSTDGIFQKIKKRFPSISFDTVNRTLLTFSDKGLARIVEGSDDVRRFDPDMGLHHHLHCIKCHNIIDFRNKSFDKIKIPEKLAKGFKAISKKVVLEGLCKKCKSSKGGRYV